MQRCHLTPVVTSVGTVVPFVKGVVDAFVRESLADEAVVFEKGVIAADDHDDVHATKVVEMMLGIELR